MQSNELDDQLSLGKRAGMAAKIGIAAAVDLVGLIVFIRSNRSLAASAKKKEEEEEGDDDDKASSVEDKSAGLRGALWVLAAWALFQMGRGLVAVGGWGVLDQVRRRHLTVTPPTHATHTHRRART
jgi:hypothetical protein